MCNLPDCASAKCIGTTRTAMTFKHISARVYVSRVSCPEWTISITGHLPIASVRKWDIEPEIVRIQLANIMYKHIVTRSMIT